VSGSFAFLMTMAAAANPAAAYPSVAVLNATKEVCAALSSSEAATQNAAAHGWSAVTAPKGTPLGDLIAFGLEAGTKLAAQDDGKVMQLSTFTKLVAGEQLSVVFSGIDYGPSGIFGCRVYDIAETRPISIADAETWLGRKADSQVSRPDLTSAKWRPGLNPENDIDFDIFFVPEGSPMIELVKVSGTALVANAYFTKAEAE
jgi:hypothetical protein